MVDRAISGDPSLAAGSIAGGDLVPVVDISEALDVDKNKSVTFTILETYFQTNLNFVDLTTAQSVGGIKTFTSLVEGEGFDFTRTAAVSAYSTIRSQANQWVGYEMGDSGVRAGFYFANGTKGYYSYWWCDGVELYMHSVSSATPRDILWTTNLGDILSYTDATGVWSFQAKDIETTGDISAADVKASSIHQKVANSALLINGGDFTTGGAALWLYGASHANAYDLDFQAAGTQLYYDHSASSWDFQSNDIFTEGDMKAGNITLNGGVFNEFGIGTLELNGAGAKIILEGDTSSFPYDIRMYGSALELEYDHSASQWDFQSNNIITDGNIDANHIVLSPGTSPATIKHGSDAGSINIQGGNTSGVGAGAALKLFGGTNTYAGDVQFFNNTTLSLEYDDSASEWDFQANAITTNGNVFGADGTFSGGITTPSITGNSLSFYPVDINDTVFETEGNIFRAIDTGYLTLSGGSSGVTGANFVLYGATHANAKDFAFRASSTTELYYDDTASSWDFQANDIVTTGELITGDVYVDGADLFIKEKAFSATALGGYGHIWVENTVPTKLWYRDDVGTDHQLGADSGGGGISWVYKTANYTMVAGEGVTINSNGTARTITLPATIAANDEFIIHHFNPSGTEVVVTVARNGHSIRHAGTVNGLAGGTADDISLADGETIHLVATTATYLEIV